MKFEQLITYDNYDFGEINGVLNFKPEDIACFWKEKNDHHNQGLYYLRIKNADAVKYRVNYKDLKTILDKEL